MAWERLGRIEKRLRTMRSHLREPGSREELEEIPAVESEFAVAIDCHLSDEILLAIAHLESAAGLTPEALRESWRPTGASRSWMGSSRNEMGGPTIAPARPPSGWLISPSGSESSARDGRDPRPDGSHAWRGGEIPQLAGEEPHRDRRGSIPMAIPPIPKGGRLAGWRWRPSGSGTLTRPLKTSVTRTVTSY